MLLLRLTCADAPPQPGGEFMARQTLRPKSRIFVDRKPAWSRLLGAAALLVALGVTVSGIGTAIFLNNRSSAPPVSSAAAQATASLPALAPPTPDLTAAAPAASQPAEPPADATALAAVEPQAGGTVPPPPAAAPSPAQAEPAPAQSAPAPAPAPIQTAALPSQPAPAPAPAPALDAPPPSVTPAEEHWVEYGVFVVGSGYAERLKQSLAEKGLDAVIVKTHDRQGHPLLRVRSAPLADLAAAQDAANRAEAALHITPLVHSGTPALGQTRFWVQFGAFHEHAGAARVQRRLARIGVQASVSAVRGESGKPLYLVRSEPLTTHDAAVALAHWAEPAAGAMGFVGETPQGEADHHPARAKPLRPVAYSR
jgi:cell division protein FtsN